MSSSFEEDREEATTDAEEAEVVESVVDAEVVEETDASAAAGNEAAPDGGGEVEQDLADLVEQARSERDEYLDLAQRTQADFENFRKRMANETAAAKLRGRLDVVEGVIEAIDNLERTMEAEDLDPVQALEAELPAEAPVSVQGVIVAYRDLHATLRSAAVEAFNPAGEQFDPTLHEALQALPSQEHPSGTVIEVMQLGYRSGETVIRPARVVVSQ